jgi:hypothetical protein
LVARLVFLAANKKRAPFLGLLSIETEHISLPLRAVKLLAIPFFVLPRKNQGSGGGADSAMKWRVAAPSGVLPTLPL